MSNRVVITGVGVLSPLGIGKDVFWDGLISGRSGIGPLTRFDCSNFTSKIAGEVRDFDPTQYLDKKEARRMDRFTQFGVVAAKMAFEDAGLDIQKEDPFRVGVILGSGIGGIETLEDQTRVLVDKGPGRISPFLVPMMIANMAAGQIAIELGAKGPNITTVTACASGTNAIGDAFKMIQRGDADVIVTGGAEAAVTQVSVGGFAAMKALSTRNDDPTKASRPFDQDRDGFVIAEGAGVLILESLEHALARGARIYAEIAGYGLSCDAYHITAVAPGGEGAAKAMLMAVRDAGLQPTDVDYINAHGTSTELNDKNETAGIKVAFGDHAYKLAVSSTKSMTGHLLGAAGGIEAIASTFAIYHGIIPPTINLDNPSPECDLDYVPTARKQEVKVSISNSLGFGGHNATILIRKYEG